MKVAWASYHYRMTGCGLEWECNLAVSRAVWDKEPGAGMCEQRLAEPCWQWL